MIIKVLQSMGELIVKWRSQAQAKEAEANNLDNERDSFTSKYYSSMDDREKQKFNDLRDRAHHLRLERNILLQCVNDLEKELT